VAKKSANFTVGLFVLLGLGLLVGGIVWLGAQKYAGSATTYATYFDESVQGLQVDSVVKYRGVAVGRVTKIRVAPDNRLIEVVMTAEIGQELAREVVSVLRMAGITGISFIELDRKEPGSAALTPKLNFAAEHPVIPSRPSEIAQILSILERVATQLNQIDFKGIGSSLNEVIAAFKKLVKGQALQKAFQDAADTMAGAKKAMEAVNRVLAGGRIEKTVEETTKAMASLKAAGDKVENLAGELTSQVAAMKLAEQAAKAGRAMDSADRMVNGLTDKTTELTESLKSSLDNLRRATRSLARLVERLEQSPSDALLAQPPAERKPPHGQVKP